MPLRTLYSFWTDVFIEAVRCGYLEPTGLREQVSENGFPSTWWTLLPWELWLCAALGSCTPHLGIPSTEVSRGCVSNSCDQTPLPLLQIPFQRTPKIPFNIHAWNRALLACQGLQPGAEVNTTHQLLMYLHSVTQTVVCGVATCTQTKLIPC